MFLFQLTVVVKNNRIISQFYLTRIWHKIKIT